MRAVPNSLAPALSLVRERIHAACHRVGRPVDDVRLVAVSKTVPAPRVRELLAAGQAWFGENRVQEALEKQPLVGPGAVWHLVGHLQRNKARHAVGAFELIHSLDDVRLADEIERRAAAAGIRQAVLIQVNVSGEDTKSGVDLDGLPALLDHVAALGHVDLHGLMTIPPPVDEPEEARPWFRRMYELRDQAASRVGRPLPELSMGMTDDFEIAVEEGATLVRVGRALFGDRPPVE